MARSKSLTRTFPLSDTAGIVYGPHRQSFYSPTDTMVSPCTAKLHLAKKKHFNK